MKPDGEVNTGWMVALGEYALGELTQEEIGELDDEDLAYIKDVQDTMERMKAAGVKNPMPFIPNY